MRDQAHRFSTATGVPCAVSLELSDELSEPSCDHALRVVREGLTNIAQHARATEASLHLTQENGTVHVVVADNGAGFDPTAVPAGHYGLHGLRERARMVGGTISVQSIPGEGATLTASFPAHTASPS